MAIVAGVDFGTLSVRVSIVDSARGVLGSATADLPLRRSREDPEHATQSHADHMRGLREAMAGALRSADVAGSAVDALACATTGSSIVPVDAAMRPLGDYYLWCDHRAKGEAEEITAAANAQGLEAIAWCGGIYSSEWGFSKLLHWLRHNPEARSRFNSAFEHCDFVAATLCGVTEPRRARRSVCAMGHKWLWNRALGGLPPDEFLVSVDPLLAGVGEKLEGEYSTSDQLAGRLSPEWAAKLALRPGIPVPVGAFDAHWDAIGAGARLGDMVNVIGTSTCMIGITSAPNLVPGVCGVVEGSVHPNRTGIEAGLSAVGDIFNAIAVRAGITVNALSAGLELYRPGQTGLLRLTWDNGDRTVLVNPNLRGVTLGWNLQSTAQDELFAAIEGTALHTRVILDRMAEHQVEVRRLIHAGGIPPKNPVLNQVYANVLQRPVLVPERGLAGLGAAIFACHAAGAFPTIEAAQDALCPPYRVYTPEPAAARVYDQLYDLFRRLYFAFGTGSASAAPLGDILSKLIALAAEASNPQARRGSTSED
jgi:L-ribulokinase